MDSPPPLPLHVSKPGRSEVEVPDAYEQQRFSEEVRLKFEMEAPKRHPKPCRSEPNLPEATEVDHSATPIPELLKFQALTQSPMTQPLLADFRQFDSQEFVETDYYKHFNAVDKMLHHMTGSGFIQVDSMSLLDDSSVVHDFKLRSLGAGTFVRTRSYCNPATNDWIPSPDDMPHVWS